MSSIIIYLKISIKIINLTKRFNFLQYILKELLLIGGVSTL